MAMYAQTDGKQHSTNSRSFVPMPGLSINLPVGVGTMAIVILNVPNPYATGGNTPGGAFGITINGALSPVQAVFTYNESTPESDGRVPTTLVAGVPLLYNKMQLVQAVWYCVRGNSVVIDSPATLTAILD